MDAFPEIQTCPTPAKNRYSTKETADRIARGAIATVLYSYQCRCGWHHLTKQAPREPAGDDLRGISATPETVAALNDEDFRLLARAELFGWATDASVSEALRDEKNLYRWDDTLKVLATEVNQQFADRKKDQSPQTKEWRERAKTYMAILATRKAEVRSLRRTLHAKKRSAENAERALWRKGTQALVRRHRAEHAALVFEEYVKAGILPSEDLRILIERYNLAVPGPRTGAEGETGTERPDESEETNA